MANVPISAFTVPANTVGIGATGYSLTGSASASFMDLAGTWNTSGTPTAIKLNITDTASNAASLLMDLQVGGVTRFNVTKAGGVNIRSIEPTLRLGYLNENQIVMNQGVLFVGSTSKLGFSSSSNGVTTSNGDAILTRRGAANLNLGEADTGTTSATVTITIAVPGVVTWSSHGLTTGSPVSFTTTGALPTGIVSGTIYYAVVVTTSTIQLASSSANAVAATPTVITTTGTQSGVHTGARNAITQRLSVQSVTGVTDRPGADMLITGSQGTGTGAGGSIVFRVAPAGLTGSTQNAFATALTIGADVNRTITFFSGASGGNQISLVTPGYFAFGAQGTSNVLLLGNSNLSPSVNLTLGTASAAYTGLYLGTAVGSGVTSVFSDDANKLALRNGAAAQTFRVYNTTDGTNSEFGEITWSSNELFIGSNTAGTGTVRVTSIRSAAQLDLYTYGATRIVRISSNGLNLYNSMQWVTDNTYDIGASGATRPRTGYFGNAIIAANGFFAGTLASAAKWNSSGDGIALITNAGASDFSRLQFGGTTSSFPALKRSTTFLQARLADDSAFTNIQGKLTTETAYTAGAVVVTGYLTLYDSTGTAYRVPCLV